MFEFRDDEIERFVPARAFKTAVAFDQWMKQTIGMMHLQVSGYTFRTKPSFVNGKVIARLDANHVIVFNEQVHSALDGAIGTVSGHDAIDHAIGAPAAVRRVVKVRAKLLDDLIQMFDFTHESIREP